MLAYRDKHLVRLGVEIVELDGAYVAIRLFLDEDDDLQIAASKLPENSAAMLILWENLWVAGIGKAIQEAGGQLVERAQIAPEVVAQFEEGLAAE